MNRHTKLAIFLAPLLVVGGYIASDYYAEYQASKDKYYQLSVKEHCDILSGRCILQSGELLLSFSDESGVTKLNTTFPIDSVSLMLVNDDSSQRLYEMEMAESPYYWQVATDLRTSISQPGQYRKLRVVAKIKGGHYLAEFISTTIAPHS